MKSTQHFAFFAFFAVKTLFMDKHYPISNQFHEQ